MHTSGKGEEGREGVLTPALAVASRLLAQQLVIHSRVVGHHVSFIALIIALGPPPFKVHLAVTHVTDSAAVTHQALHCSTVNRPIA